MTGDFAVLRRRYDVDDLRPHLIAEEVTATIAVQVRADLAETVDLLELCSRTPLIVGVVGWADLTSPDVGAQIDELRAGTGGEHLVGLRHAAADEPDPDWLLRHDVGAGMQALAERGLTFDLEITVRELAAADSFVQRHQEVRFVVDHGAKPPVAQGWSDEWADGIAALGRNQHVWCKLSGLVTEASWTTWEPADLQPYVDHLLDAFGAQRVMFGSDWPVCELASTYRNVVAATGHCLAAVDGEARRDIFCRNALRFYRPPGAGPRGEQ